MQSNKALHGTVLASLRSARPARERRRWAAMKRTLLVAMVLLSSVSGAADEDAPIVCKRPTDRDPPAAWIPYAECMHEQKDCTNPGNTIEINECLMADLRAEDHDLNVAYQEALKPLDERGQQLLRKAQRAWISFRNANCDVYSDWTRGGTMTAAIDLQCNIRMTRDRASELRSMNDDDN